MFVPVYGLPSLRDVQVAPASVERCQEKVAAGLARATTENVAGLPGNWFCGSGFWAMAAAEGVVGGGTVPVIS